MGKIVSAVCCLIVFFHTSVYACDKDKIKYSCETVWVENEYMPDEVVKELIDSECEEEIFGKNGIMAAYKMNDFCDRNNLRNRK